MSVLENKCRHMWGGQHVCGREVGHKGAHRCVGAGCDEQRRRPTVRRTLQMNLRLQPDEIALARRLADECGLSVQEFIRSLIRDRAGEAS